MSHLHTVTLYAPPSTSNTETPSQCDSFPVPGNGQQYRPTSQTCFPAEPATVKGIWAPHLGAAPPGTRTLGAAVHGDPNTWGTKHMGTQTHGDPSTWGPGHMGSPNKWRPEPMGTQTLGAQNLGLGFWTPGAASHSSPNAG
eukprot:jgi/Botrbrau1/7490/Bobra.0095s0026.1